MTTERIRLSYSDAQFEVDGLKEKDYVTDWLRRYRSFYERDVLETIASATIGGGMVVDVGAHIGNHTLFFAGILGRNTLSFEPNAAAFKLLKKNVRLNGLEEKVELHQAGVGGAKGRAALHKCEKNAGASALVRDSSGLVDVVTLDSMLSSFSERIAVLKIDVEGAEADVIRGARESIQKDRPLLCIEVHDAAASQDVFPLIQELGYYPLAICGRSRNWLCMPEQSSMEGDCGRVLSARIEIEEVRRRLANIHDTVKADGKKADSVTEYIKNDISLNSSELRKLRSDLNGMHERVVGELRASGRYMLEVQRCRSEIDRLRERNKRIDSELAKLNHRFRESEMKRRELEVFKRRVANSERETEVWKKKTAIWESYAHKLFFSRPLRAGRFARRTLGRLLPLKKRVTIGDIRDKAKKVRK